MKRVIIFILVIMSMLQWSCEKDEFTVPVNVDFVISMDANEVSEYLQFYSGIIAIEDITFQGERQEGEDVFFTSKPGVIFQPQEFSNNSMPVFVTHFDIPQGKYVLMNWGFTLSELFSDEEIDVEDDLEIEDDLEDNEIDAGLIINGMYTFLNGMEVPVIIGIEGEEKFKVYAEASTEVFEVNLIEENEYNAQLVLDLSSVFSSISRDSFENADLNDENEILITSDENDDLYELILYRLEKNSKVVFSIK